MQIILYVLSLSPFFCLFVFCFRISWVTTNLINNYTGPSNAPESGKTTGERRAQLDRLLDTNKKIVTIVRIKAKLKWTNVDAFPTTTAATKCLTHTVETPRRVTRTKEETNKNAAPVYSIWHDVQQYEPNENSCRSPIERTLPPKLWKAFFFSPLLLLPFFCTRKRKRGLPSLT